MNYVICKSLYNNLKLLVKQMGTRPDTAPIPKASSNGYTPYNYSAELCILKGFLIILFKFIRASASLLVSKATCDQIKNQNIAKMSTKKHTLLECNNGILKTNIRYYTEQTLSNYWFYDPVM